MYKVIVSQKKESFLKQIPSRFMLMSTWKISILPTHLFCVRRPGKTWIFALVWMKMQIHSLPLGAAFGALKAHKHGFKWNRTKHHRLASRKGGVWKNESLNESFGGRWVNKVKINAYYKKWKYFIKYNYQFYKIIIIIYWPKFHNRVYIHYILEGQYDWKWN